MSDLHCASLTLYIILLLVLLLLLLLPLCYPTKLFLTHEVLPFSSDPPHLTGGGRRWGGEQTGWAYASSGVVVYLPFLFRTFLNSASFSNIFYKLRLKYEPFFPFLKNHKQDGLIKESDIKRWKHDRNTYTWFSNNLAMKFLTINLHYSFQYVFSHGRS